MEVLTSFFQNCIILLMIDFSVLHARALALRPRCDTLSSLRELEECENMMFPANDKFFGQPKKLICMTVSLVIVQLQNYCLRFALIKRILPGRAVFFTGRRICLRLCYVILEARMFRFAAQS